MYDFVFFYTFQFASFTKYWMTDLLKILSNDLKSSCLFNSFVMEVLWYRNQWSKSLDWFIYDRNLHHERTKKSVPENKKENVCYLFTSIVDKSIFASPI